MKIHAKYIDGETELAYKELLKLEDRINDSNVMYEIDKVLTEIFSRVEYNSEIIFKELKKINYCFWGNSALNTLWPIRKPRPNSEKLLKTLEVKVKQFGYLPLSLKYFYRIVGSLNFTWNYQENESIKWEGSDPLQVIAIDDIIEIVTEIHWEAEMNEYLKDKEHKTAFLEISGDYLHKDNISGGPQYSLVITKNPSIDSLMLNMPEKIGLIDYLRICFENCGFYRNSHLLSNKEYIKFVNKVKPKLKKI